MISCYPILFVPFIGVMYSHLTFTVESFKVGLDLVINLEIRPRVLSGVLLSVISQRGDYLILEMVNGNVSSLPRVILLKAGPM